MLKKLLFFLFILLAIRSLYFIAKLFSFQLENLSDFGQGALLGHLILSVILILLALLLGRNIWFKKVNE